MTRQEHSEATGLEEAFSWPAALGILTGIRGQLQEQDAGDLLNATVPRFTKRRC